MQALFPCHHMDVIGSEPDLVTLLHISCLKGYSFLPNWQFLDDDANDLQWG